MTANATQEKQDMAQEADSTSFDSLGNQKL